MLKYVGDGAYIHGVPARDLSDFEEEQHIDIIAEQEQLTGLALYEPMADVAPFVVEDEETGEES